MKTSDLHYTSLLFCHAHIGEMDISQAHLKTYLDWILLEYFVRNYSYLEIRKHFLFVVDEAWGVGVV